MSFCRNCGVALVDDAKFCHNCGSGTRIAERKVEYSGKLMKCPACGEVLDSFVHRCPTCGMELRQVKATSSVRELALKLEDIELHREYEKPHGLFSYAKRLSYISKTDEQKISLIKNFAIPNTKEDILEFMILASSNTDMSIYSSFETPAAGLKAMTEAWTSKMQQAYLKATHIFSASSDFPEIQALNNDYLRLLKKHKRKRTVKYCLIGSWMPFVILCALILGPIALHQSEAEELSRLEAIVVAVEDALETKKYKCTFVNDVRPRKLD